MKEIKIGAINFIVSWCGRDVDERYIVYDVFLNSLKLSNKYKYVYIDDPYNNECDIVFYSLWNNLNNLKKCKGNPIFVYYTHEYLCGGADENLLENLGILNQKVNQNIYDNEHKTYEFGNYILNEYKLNNYSLSFNKDSKTNLYYPWWLMDYHMFYNKYKVCDRSNIIKNKFCVFISSHEKFYNAQVRIDFVKELSNYKKVTCPGNALHNTGDFYLPYLDDIAHEYCKNFKFYVSFENAKSCEDINYVTEKLLYGWKYGCVPLYWGDNRNLDEYFNKEAYIDLSDMTQEQMINKVIELDKDDELYKYHLNQYLFKDKNINYYELFGDRLINFIENIIN